MPTPTVPIFDVSFIAMPQCFSDLDQLLFTYDLNHMENIHLKQKIFIPVDLVSQYQLKLVKL